MPVRVVLVDDHEMVIEGLKAMLAPFADRVEVLGEAVGADRALAVIDELSPTSCSATCACRASAGWTCAGRSGNTTPAAR